MRALLRSWAARVRELFRAERLEAERDEEFRFHVEMQTEYNISRGMNPREARRAALVPFGGVDRYREATRDARGVVALGNLLRDARFAFRRLRRSPAFSLGVVLTIGVGAALRSRSARSCTACCCGRYRTTGRTSWCTWRS